MTSENARSLQDATPLVARIETPSEASELRQPIGELIWARRKHRVTPLDAVRVQPASRDDDDEVRMLHTIVGFREEDAQEAPQHLPPNILSLRF